MKIQGGLKISKVREGGTMEENLRGEIICQQDLASTIVLGRKITAHIVPDSLTIETAITSQEGLTIETHTKGRVIMRRKLGKNFLRGYHLRLGRRR